MNKLMTVDAWIRSRYVDDSGPDQETVIRWIEEGHLEGEQQGDQYFIPEGAVYVSREPRAGEASAERSRTSRLVKRGVPWYFLTRDGEDDQGPFETGDEARAALTRFLENIQKKRAAGRTPPG